jgi:hypothetical protein
MMKDMFGNEVDLQALMDAPMTGKRKRKPTPKRGHYFKPGTGPEGETCGTCKHLTRRHLAKTYIKCGLNERNWTGGPGSDIRVKDAACKFWEPDTPSPPPTEET